MHEKEEQKRALLTDTKLVQGQSLSTEETGTVGEWDQGQARGLGNFLVSPLILLQLKLCWDVTCLFSNNRI